MQLKTTSNKIFDQLIQLLEQLKSSEYAAKLALLEGNSVGKHVRHIIEFVEILIEGYMSGKVNYDKRKHSTVFEQDINASMDKIHGLRDSVASIELGKKLILEVSYQKDAENVHVESSVDRELAYNIEHAIHHMAIIKIAIQTAFPYVNMPDNFGVAYSTVRYQREKSIR